MLGTAHGLSRENETTTTPDQLTREGGVPNDTSSKPGGVNSVLYSEQFDKERFR